MEGRMNGWMDGTIDRSIYIYICIRVYIIYTYICIFI